MLVNMGVEKRRPGLGKSFLRGAVKQLFRRLCEFCRLLLGQLLGSGTAGCVGQ